MTDSLPHLSTVTTNPPKPGDSYQVGNTILTWDGVRWEVNIFHPLPDVTESE